MHTRVLSGCFFLCALLTSCGDREAALAPEPDEALTLSTPRRDYLLGEPVLLELSYRNLTKDPINVMEPFIQPGYYESPVCIARRGESFREFLPSHFIKKRTHRVVSVAPGESVKYQYRVVGGVPRERDGFELAFPKLGEYRVYALYGENASNVVQVRVTQPAAEDEKVWRKLNDPSLLWLLQVEAMGREEKDVLMKTTELLRTSPMSGYAPALRHALSKIYFHHSNRLGLPQEDVSRLGSILGINEVVSFKDARLAAPWKLPIDATKMSFEEVIVKLQEKRSVTQILRSLKEDSGVHLDAPAQVLRMEAESDGNSQTVAQYMQFLSNKLEASWEKRGNGYFLVPFKPDQPPEKEKANPEKR